MAAILGLGGCSSVVVILLVVLQFITNLRIHYELLYLYNHTFFHAIKVYNKLTAVILKTFSDACPRPSSNVKKPYFTLGNHSNQLISIYGARECQIWLVDLRVA